MNITIYDGPRCMQCRATKRAFDKAGITYDTTPAHLPDGTIHPDIASLGHHAMPVVTITDGDQITAHWSGLSIENITAATHAAAIAYADRQARTAQMGRSVRDQEPTRLVSRWASNPR